MDLGGKVVLVMGLISGIGFGIVWSLVKKGCVLILIGLGD